MNTLLEKFLAYVKIDTQAQHDATQVPSTAKQLDLSKLLYDQLNQMGASDVKLDSHGYVYAEIPANTDSKFVLGFIAHIDTSDAVSGENVKPQIHKNYDGKDIKLSDGYVLSTTEFPELKNHIGKTLITTDGTTLLGADDKAGVAAIMQLCQTLLQNPSIKHGKIKIAFTPDEEVGRGTDFFDVDGFGCDGAYTVDGEKLGQLQYENFNACQADIFATGMSVHPGTAKGKMVNASLLLMELHSLLPVFENPAYTEKYEGFFHLDRISGSVDSAKSRYIIRDHDSKKFADKKQFIQKCVDFLNAKYRFEALTCVLKDSYFNMVSHLTQHMHLVDNAKIAIKKAGIEPVVEPIRGGTDGAVLSYKGLPCPNLFTGGANFHGRFEYIALEDLEKVVEVLINLSEIYGA